MSVFSSSSVGEVPAHLVLPSVQIGWRQNGFSLADNIEKTERTVREELEVRELSLIPISISYSNPPSAPINSKVLRAAQNILSGKKQDNYEELTPEEKIDARKASRRAENTRYRKKHKKEGSATYKPRYNYEGLAPEEELEALKAVNRAKSAQYRKNRKKEGSATYKPRHTYEGLTPEEKIEARKAETKALKAEYWKKYKAKRAAKNTCMSTVEEVASSSQALYTPQEDAGYQSAWEDFNSITAYVLPDTDLEDPNQRLERELKMFLEGNDEEESYNQG